MIKLSLTLALLFPIFFPAFSQVKQPDAYKEQLFVRFNVLGLADVLDENLSTGLEYRFHPNWSAGTDVGWIFFSRYLTTNKGANGVMLRPFIRYYPTQGDGFFEAELHYKYVSYKVEDWLGRAPVNNVPTYQEYTKFHYNKNAAGVHIKGGVKTNLDREKKLFFEFTGGLGIRWKWQAAKEGVYKEGGGITDIFNPRYVGPVVLINMRLLYTIK